MMLQAGLEHYDFRIWTAADTQEGNRLYQENRDDIDIVLLDAAAPHMTGIKALEALQEIDAKVVACFINGDASLWPREELMTRGARFVFGRAYPLDEIARVCRLLLYANTIDVE